MTFKLKDSYSLVALLPMKANSERVKGKNFKSFCGKPLFKWVLDTLLSCNDIELIVINTDAGDIIYTLGGADYIYGRNGNDKIYGGLGNDTIEGGLGDDTINGGNGNDTAIFNYDFSNYTVDQSDSVIITSSTEGRDTLTGIELVKFADKPVERASLARVLFEEKDSNSKTVLPQNNSIKNLKRERGVDVNVNRLRKKLEENPKFPRYLKTVRGVGYMLLPD